MKRGGNTKGCVQRTGGSYDSCFFREDVMPSMVVLLSRERPVDGRRRRKVDRDICCFAGLSESQRRS